jgi:AcrR family transcriptional regulator
MPTTAANPPGGLRERKRERTHRALIEAAARVFAQRGYDAATVEEIAAEVDVSPRTFFRYFAGKDAVALAWLDQYYAEVHAELAVRPAGESPLEAMTAAIVVAWRATDHAAYTQTMELVQDSPVLLAAWLRRDDSEGRALAASLAARESRPADDFAVRALVAGVGATMRVATEVCQARGDALGAGLEHALDEGLRALRDQLAGLSPSAAAAPSPRA